MDSPTDRRCTVGRVPRSAWCKMLSRAYPTGDKLASLTSRRAPPETTKDTYMQDIANIIADLTEIDGQPMTDSLKVAARFGKRHDNALKAIRAISAIQPEFAALNFEESAFKDKNGRGRPMFRMTKNGFAMLAMGFTGAAAMQWKVLYITAFDRMAEEIARAAHVPAVPLTLHEQALKLHAEAKTSETLATIYGRGLRKRRDDKPVFARQMEQIERAMQICLFLGLDGLPEIE